MTREGLRLSLFYAAIFALIGVLLPYWPVWLAWRGLDAAEIGLVLSAGFWCKVVTGPAIAALADRSGARRVPMLLLALVGLAAMGAFSGAEGLWPILLLWVVANNALSSMLPLGETLTMQVVRERQLDYGRVRLWGSIAFILASVGAGTILEANSPAIVLWFAIGGAAAVVAICAALPDRKVAPARGSAWSAPAGLLRDRRFMLFLAAAGLVQASHAAYYGFATLHWQRLGFSDGTIGWLWAEGVIAEIALFMVAGSAVARIGPVPLLALAACGGVLRWTATAFADDLTSLAVLQVLHAATFGAAHLAAMHFIAGHAAPGRTATAQALYSAVSSGIAMGALMGIAGLLFEASPSLAFLGMAAPCAVAALLCLLLRRP